MSWSLITSNIKHESALVSSKCSYLPPSCLAPAKGLGLCFYMPGIPPVNATSCITVREDNLDTIPTALAEYEGLGFAPKSVVLQQSLHGFGTLYPEVHI